MKTNNHFTREDAKLGSNFERQTISFDITRADTENKLIPCVLSTETPVITSFGKEVLLHTKDSVDLRRAKKNGIPLLGLHKGEPVGRIRDLEVINRKLVGTLIFSSSSRGQEFYRDVMDEIITDISVGGCRDKIQPRNASGLTVVERWTPLEGSLVAIGADENAGINRNFNKGEEMTEEEKAALEEAQLKKGQEAERIRRNDVTEIFSRHIKIDGVDDLQAKCLKDGSELDICRTMLLDHIGSKQVPANKAPSHAFDVGATEKDKFAIGINRALSIRVGCATDDEKKDVGQNEFISYTPMEMARHYLKIHGINTKGFTRQDIVGEAFIRGSIHGTATTSDFPNILADVANKSMLKGYNETPETWTQWCQVGNLADFKVAHRVNMSEFGELPEVPEGGEYSHGKFSDLSEKIRLLTFGKLFTISRQALINDDLSALSSIPRGMGRAAQRKVGDLVYGVLIDNPIMNQDSTALFHANHNNLINTGAPTVYDIDLMRTLMALQKGPAGEATLGIQPVHILVPYELQGSTRVLIKAQYDPAATSGTLTPNPEQDLLNVVPEHRLSASSATAWYLTASTSMTDTMEVAFLNGNQNPYLEQQEGFTRDGVSHKVRIDAGVAPMDFRGMSKNIGVGE